MEQEVEGERAEVKEGGDESPVLVLDKDGAEGVEELEGRDNVALDKD